MNCLECQELLQRVLDGESHDERRTEVEPHLTICTNCREFHAAGQRLLEGLRYMPTPMPPADLTAKVTSRVLSQGRRLRFQRRVVAAAALAATLLLAWVGFRSFQGSPDTTTASTPPEESRPGVAKPVPLDRGMAQAGLAIVAITRRAADETVGQGRLLLPVVVPNDVLPKHQANAPSPQPAASLQEVRQTVSLGLEPITTSARRAVDLFLREIPPMPVDRKQGL